MIPMGLVNRLLKIVTYSNQLMSPFYFTGKEMYFVALGNNSASFLFSGFDGSDAYYYFTDGLLMIPLKHAFKLNLKQTL